MSSARAGASVANAHKSACVPNLKFAIVANVRFVPLARCLCSMPTDRKLAGQADELPIRHTRASRFIVSSLVLRAECWNGAALPRAGEVSSAREEAAQQRRDLGRRLGQ